MLFSREIDAEPGCDQGRASVLRQIGKNEITGSGDSWEIYRGCRACRRAVRPVMREKAPNFNETRGGVFICFRDKTRRRGRRGVPIREKTKEVQ